MENEDFGRRPRRNNLPFGYIVAFLFFAGGLLLLGKNLGIIDKSLYYSLASWPMVIIVLGVYFLFKKEYTSGLIIVAVGIYFLISKFYCWLNPYLTSLFWPIILIAIGLVTFLQIRKKKNRPELHSHHNPEIDNAAPYTSTNGYIYSDNSFSSVKHAVIDEAFKGGAITNNFGAVVIDLRRAWLEEQHTYLNIDSKFGGIDLYVPSTWNVRIDISPFIGGCDDTRFPAATVDTEHTLVLRGSLAFSGIEIKS